MVVNRGRPPAVPTPLQDSADSSDISRADGFKGRHAARGDIDVGAADHWSLLGTAGDWIYAYLDMSQASPPQAGLQLAVLDDSGGMVESAWGNGQNRTVAGAFATSDVSMLRVLDGGFNDAVQNYALFAAAFDPLDLLDHGVPYAPTIPQATWISSDTRHRAAIFPDGIQYYGFSAYAGEQVVVIVDEDPSDAGPPASLDLDCSVRDADDNVLAAGYGYFVAFGPQAEGLGPATIPSTTNYYLRCANYDDTSAFGGHYEFVVLRNKAFTN